MADTTSDAGTNWNENVEYLRGLAQIVRESELSVLEIETDGFKLTLRGARPQLVAAPETLASVPLSALPLGVQSAPTSTPAPATEEALVPVVSPMVGVWYRAPSPTEANFVEVGDRVEVGQTIGLVEAMKVFNEITAETGGVVAQIPAQTGGLVETGQPLLMLRR
jgi:acetyl-CoA carboxylase biotin carboxyl carrier protein